MATTPRYLTLAGNKLTLQDLVEQIMLVIEDDGLSSLHIKDTLRFYDTTGAFAAGIRYDATTDTLQFSTNGGASWDPITSETFWWDSSKQYAAGTVVLHTTGWYTCNYTTTDQPGQSAAWTLLTSGSLIKYVSNSNQLKQALETQADSLMIVIRGDISSTCNASVRANTVSIWSDESSRISSAITLNTTATAKIYWHSNGTRVINNSTIAVSSGTLYIDRLTVTYGTLSLTGNCKYQRIDGSFTGGTQESWAIPSTSHLLDKDLSKLSKSQYSDTLKLYVNSANGYGYITTSEIASRASKDALKYFKIHASAPLAQRPTTATAGYIFYANDTGDLYIMDEAGEWGPAIHFRGPAGSNGKNGVSGYTFIPTLDAEGNLSWEAKIIPVTEIGPEVPLTRNIQGSPGASAFDIWKEATNNASATVEDYLQALGVGSRKTAFINADVSSRQVILDTNYPVIGIEDNDGVQWALPSQSVRYMENRAYVDLTSVYEGKDMLATGAVLYAAGNIPYTRDPGSDTATQYAWSTTVAFPYTVFTDSSTPAASDLVYYIPENSDIEGDVRTLYVDRYVEAQAEKEITGTWYALLSCGGGNDGKSSITEIISAVTLPKGQKAYIKDIELPSFEANDIVYIRQADLDITDGGLYAWAASDSVVYTDTLDITSGETVCYTDATKAESVVITAYLSKSTATHRRYEVGIPEGPLGTSYGVPMPFDIETVYSPPSDTKNTYDIVLHQGGSWVYIGETASAGNVPPTLPVTENEYWRLMSAPGEDGIDVGTGISVMRFELRKPVSNMNLFLEVMQSTTGKLSDAVSYINTLTDASSRSKVRVWDKNTNSWVLMTANGFDATYNNAPVIVDMSGNKEERYLFYRWRTPSNSGAQWQTAMFPNSKPLDTLIGLTPEGTISFTATDMVSASEYVITPMRYILAVIDEQQQQYPVTMDMVSYDLDADTTTVDLSEIMTARGITSITGTWKILTNVGVTDTVVEGDHTHLNKNIIDLIGIDLLGNIMIDGVVLVSAEDRNTSRYLIDPGLFPETQEELDALLIDPDTFSISTERVDPGEYSAIKVNMYRASDTYNSTMRTRIMNPSSYSTNVPQVDSEI